MSVPDLKTSVENYCKIDNEIRELIAKVMDLRKVRSDLEMNVIEIMSTEQFKNHEKIQVSADGSYIRILRPTTWNKPWNLSKGLLKQMLEEYHKTTRSPSADECYTFICETMKPMLVSDSYAIERVVKK
jgi:hypothetical protein